MSSTAIRIENLSKAFVIGTGIKRSDTLAGDIMQTLRSPLKNLRHLRGLNTYRLSHNDTPVEDSGEIYWSLKNIDLEIKKGEVLGILGPNGAGKSTLLKVLSRITTPTRGRIELHGRVGSLLEVGTGFHPELTGRENIYMNGTILGMKKKEIDKRFDEILDFSGVEKFLDTPTKRWSSGMRVRLAFAVAANLDPEILIVDEVLAVGDLAFQQKCLGKMQGIASNGRTVLFVSHNMAAVKLLCSTAVMLDKGRLTEKGEVNHLIRLHQAGQIATSKAVPLDQRQDRKGSGEAILSKISISSAESVNTLECGKPGTISVEISSGLKSKNSERLRQTVANRLQLNIYNQDRVKVMSIDTQEDLGISFPEDCSKVTIEFKTVNLTPGQYSLDTELFCNLDRLDKIDNALVFEITPGDIHDSGCVANFRSAATIAKYHLSIS